MLKNNINLSGEPHLIKVVYVSRSRTNNTRKYMIGSELLTDIVVFHRFYVHSQCISAETSLACLAING